MVKMRGGLTALEAAADDIGRYRLGLQSGWYEVKYTTKMAALE